MKTNGLKQIAKLAGVSHVTASRALNNRPGVSDTVRKRILGIAEKLEYGGSPRNRVVAVIFPHIREFFPEYFYRLFHHLSNALVDSGCAPELLFDDDKREFDAHYISGVISIKAVGHIARNWAGKYSKPLVCINDYNFPLDNVISVCSDDNAAIRSGFDLLRKHGRRRIALVLQEQDTLNSQNRLIEFSKTAENAGMKAEIVRIGRIDGDERLIPPLPPADGFLCASEHISRAFLRKAEREDSSAECVVWTYPLEERIATSMECTFFSQNFEDLSHAAANELLRLVSGKSASNRLIPYRTHTAL